VKQDYRAAGLKLFVCSKNSGDPPLGGNAGTNDAQLALEQAKAIGQPPGSAIYFAMEHLPRRLYPQRLAGREGLFPANSIGVPGHLQDRRLQRRRCL